MTNNVLLNIKQAAAEMNITYYLFKKIVNSGELCFKIIDGKKYFPKWAIEQWLKSTQNLTAFSKEVKSGTSTLPMAEHSLDALLAQRTAQRLKNTPCKKSLILKGKPNLGVAG